MPLQFRGKIYLRRNTSRRMATDLRKISWLWTLFLTSAVCYDIIQSREHYMQRRLIYSPEIWWWQMSIMELLTLLTLVVSIIGLIEKKKWPPHSKWTVIFINTNIGRQPLLQCSLFFIVYHIQLEKSSKFDEPRRKVLCN